MGRWRDVLGGGVHTATATSDQRWLFMGQALSTLPVAVLVPEPD